MSTFKGFLRDPLLDFIALDYFHDGTHHCTVFLLSHLHSDHFKGFFDSTFLTVLNQSEDKYVYCSPVTRNFLINRARYINKDKIVALDISKAFIIPQKKLDTDVVVTCLPAGHCPGSVMFLLEYNNRRILYTGDIRFNVDDLKIMKGRLSNADGSVIPVNELYLDTTFAVPSQFDDFPSREDSEKVIIENIETWLADSTQFNKKLKVILDIPANFGSEYLYIRLFKKFKKPIAIHNYKYYSKVEEMAGYVVTFEDVMDEPDKWLIHACRFSTCSIYSKGYRLRIIKPCVASFILNKSQKFPVHKLYNVPYAYSHKELKILYSSHCSLNELRNFVKYVQPVDVIPNVEHTSISVPKMLALVRGEGPSIPPLSEIPELSSKDNVLANIKRPLLPSVPKRSREENELMEKEIQTRLKLKF